MKHIYDSQSQRKYEEFVHATEVQLEIAKDSNDCTCREMLFAKHKKSCTKGNFDPDTCLPNCEQQSVLIKDETTQTITHNIQQMFELSKLARLLYENRN